MVITLQTKHTTKVKTKFTEWFTRFCTEGECYIHDVMVKEVDSFTEIDTEIKTSEEPQEQTYTGDQMKKIAFAYYVELSKKMGVPEELISKEDFATWFETLKDLK